MSVYLNVGVASNQWRRALRRNTFDTIHGHNSCPLCQVKTQFIEWRQST